MALVPKPKSTSGSPDATTSIFDLDSWADYVGLIFLSVIVLVYGFFLFQFITNKEFRARSLGMIKGFSAAFFGANQPVQTRMADIRQELSEIRSLIKARGPELSDASEAKIIESFDVALRGSFSDEIRDALGSFAKREIVSATDSNSVNELEILISRMDAAASSVSARGVVNLLLGIVTAIAALVVLYSGLTAFPIGVIETLSFKTIVYVGLMRISIAVFITFISYFFLSLYRRSLDEVRYYQSELSNLHAWKAAMMLAQNSADKVVKAYTIARLLETDRADQIKEVGKTSEGGVPVKMSGEILKAIIERIPKG